MKRYKHSGGFTCSHCRHFVVINRTIGTGNRNHCNWCLWSKHVDVAKGDRKAICRGGMMPIGLTFKHEGYGRIGEIMLIHLCSACSKVSINRIARDDLEHKILEVFYASSQLSKQSQRMLQTGGIYLLTKADEQQVGRQLFGG
ncbi:MAG TPA: RNHCP domain-containing protein [Candidatus Saccharimonadales bacterium]|nr:RNHCP domain-containing protein [Candidatus Saccharimonadales bacterium]